MQVTRKVEKKVYKKLKKKEKKLREQKREIEREMMRDGEKESQSAAPRRFSLTKMSQHLVFPRSDTMSTSPVSDSEDGVEASREMLKNYEGNSTDRLQSLGQPVEQQHEEEPQLLEQRRLAEEYKRLLHKVNKVRD